MRDEISADIDKSVFKVTALSLTFEIRIFYSPTKEYPQEISAPKVAFYNTLPFWAKSLATLIHVAFLLEILPLVEFSHETDIDDAEAERLLMAPPKSNAVHLDPFTDTMVHEDLPDILPMTLDRDSLRAIDPTTVLFVKWPPPLRTKYYRNLLPELQISICPECLMVIFDSVIFTTN